MSLCESTAVQPVCQISSCISNIHTYSRLREDHGGENLLKNVDINCLFIFLSIQFKVTCYRGMFCKKEKSILNLLSVLDLVLLYMFHVKDVILGSWRKKRRGRKIHVWFNHCWTAHTQTDQWNKRRFSHWALRGWKYLRVSFPACLCEL